VGFSGRGCSFDKLDGFLHEDSSKVNGRFRGQHQPPEVGLLCDERQRQPVDRIVQTIKIKSCQILNDMRAVCVCEREREHVGER